MVASAEMSVPRLFVDLRAKASTEPKQQEQRIDASLDVPAAGDAAAIPPAKTSADTGAEAPAPATQHVDSQTHATDDTDGSTNNKTPGPGASAAAESEEPVGAALAQVLQMVEQAKAKVAAAKAAVKAGTWDEGNSRAEFLASITTLLAQVPLMALRANRAARDARAASARDDGES